MPTNEAADFDFRKYAKESRRPIYSAILVLPYLVTYEIGIVLMQSGALGPPSLEINGGDYLVRRMLATFGVHYAFVSAAVLGITFFIWDYRKSEKNSFSFDGATLFLHFLESVIFAVLLSMISLYLWEMMTATPMSCPVAAKGSWLLGRVRRLILYCGAGVYEELVFRVFLLALLDAVFVYLLRWKKEEAVVASIILGALLFSLFHYLPPGGDPFSIRTFLIRAFAGVYFAVLYRWRSFGVAASAHALYDVIVGLGSP